MTDRLSHVGPDGSARMVDVSSKPVTLRTARAVGSIRMAPETLAAIQANALEKGDVLGVARIAGIMAAKRTAELIPLCHPLPIEEVTVEFFPDPAIPGVRVETSARTVARTGIEMEAIIAATIALATVYDMAKAIDRGMAIESVRLVEKTGGSSGTWIAG